MSEYDWRWKLGEVVERIRTRYQHIGRKTGAPFLAVIYPREEEAAVRREWQTQSCALAPEYRLHTLDLLAETDRVLAELGVDHVVSSLQDPMPGSDPLNELGSLFVSTIADSVHEAISQTVSGRPVVCLTRVAALYPAAGPRDVMQRLWDSAKGSLDAPVVVFIPGTLRDARTYAFLDTQNEFMYRGDLL